MKKWGLVIIATMLAAGTVQAQCSSCGADAKKAKGKAACEVKSGRKKAECAATAAKCSAEKKAECSMEKANASCKMQGGQCAKKGSKWNPLNWFK